MENSRHRLRWRKGTVGPPRGLGARGRKEVVVKRVPGSFDARHPVELTRRAVNKGVRLSQPDDKPEGWIELNSAEDVMVAANRVLNLLLAGDIDPRAGKAAVSVLRSWLRVHKASRRR